MPTRQFKPVTAGTRFRSVPDFTETSLHRLLELV